MHMADALLSPAVGVTMWVATAGTIAYSSHKLKESLDDRRIPLMAVLGAFVFAAQMINFTIPGTGSSGHLGGGMLLAILLGPHAAFLTIASVLTVQALFFADGGLLALGSNVFNLGFFPCFIAYPLFYKPLAGDQGSSRRVFLGTMVAAVAGLQLGAFGVVVETFVSGVSSLPFETFALLMQPIHLAIGVVEGLVTVAVVAFIWKERPEILETQQPLAGHSLRRVIASLAVLALLAGGVLSWFASSHPDGLEWALAKATGGREPEVSRGDIYTVLAQAQEKSALLPDYGFRKDGSVRAEENKAARSVVDPGTSVAGVVGGGLTLGLVVLIGVVLKWRKRSLRQ